MLFNETVLSLKLRYLDSTPLEFVQHVAETLAGAGARIVEVPRQWTPGGGSQNFMVFSDAERFFLKAKHKSLLVESALESEPAFSAIPALQNEHSFLRALSASPHVPAVRGFVEQGDYMFLATEALQPFDVIRTFSPMQIVEAYQQLAAFVRELYDRGIVHTDIHEKNICFRGRVPVLIDFEEARLLRQDVPFEASLDVVGQNGVDNVGEFPALESDSIRGLTCLKRLKEVFKRILRPLLPDFLSQCNFDCNSAFNLDTEQQPDERIYQSVSMPDLTIVGQRPVHDQRLDYVRMAFEYAHDLLGRRLDIVDLGANMGMVAFFCGAAPQVRSVVGLEADPRYVEAAKVLAFYNDSPQSVVFEEYMTGNRPYTWNTDVLLMLSVYHHVADKDAFLQELAAKKITCIIGEFAVQERYYPQRGSVEAEIAHIKKTLGFKYVECLAVSQDYQRPLVVFHNGPQSIRKTKASAGSPRSAEVGWEASLQTRADKALEWVHANSGTSAGVYVSNQQKVLYPEVTGYFIPTLLQWGQTRLALQYAHWLMAAQQPDGSFSGPGIPAPFAFDIGQAIRGLAAITPILPEASAALDKACQWIVRTASTEGRLCLPADMGAWSLGARGHINEAIHLYVLPGMLQASEALNTPVYAQFARHSLSYYIRHCNLTNFLAPNMLLHFYCYIQEALFDMGAHDICRSGMRDLAERQTDAGLLPAYADVSWVCTPGLIQAGLVWCKLQDMERASLTLQFASSLQNTSGGFPGSVGAGAEYFPDEEPSWAVKFWLDAVAQYASGRASSGQRAASGPEEVSSFRPVLKENDIPVIQLESAAITELERSCRQAVERYAALADPDALGEIAASIPVLLDWGRRDLALLLAAVAAKAVQAPAHAVKPWEADNGLFLLGRLIRAFRQPEVIGVYGDTLLKSFCLNVFRRQRQSAETAPGLFFCFNELKAAGIALHDQSWLDCATHWAGKQETLSDQEVTPELVWDLVSAGQLLDQSACLPMLEQVAACLDRVPCGEPQEMRDYALLALALAWGAWTLGDDALATTTYRKGASLLAGSAAAKGLQGDALLGREFLEALRAMQACRFAMYFPQFLDDIDSDDGRLQFVQRNLPEKADSRVLDMGTGKGRYLRRLHYARAAGSLTGQDVHPAFAGFMPRGVGVGVGTVLRSGWKDGTFDSVLLCEVLEHCIDLPAAVNELRRILADGGTLIIVDKNIQRLASWQGGIPPWEQWFDCGELAALLRDRGFVITDVAADVPYEGRRDGLFFGIAAQKA